MLSIFKMKPRVPFRGTYLERHLTPGKTEYTIHLLPSAVLKGIRMDEFHAQDSKVDQFVTILTSKNCPPGPNFFQHFIRKIIAAFPLPAAEKEAFLRTVKTSNIPAIQTRQTNTHCGKTPISYSCYTWCVPEILVADSAILPAHPEIQDSTQFKLLPLRLTNDATHPPERSPTR